MVCGGALDCIILECVPYTPSNCKYSLHYVQLEECMDAYMCVCGQNFYFCWRTVVHKKGLYHLICVYIPLG